ncbi:uncharacterized protein LOC122721806 [Manihot esculenta]|uniref:uncharacterized protein LOC122721806 n=1 Tax=Manihot esculenta TaxID=3983 RepID=UPI001CC3FCD8|nr:uncharacterized protein LOC122721806 [Manihot esculenta]
MADHPSPADQSQAIIDPIADLSQKLFQLIQNSQNGNQKSANQFNLDSAQPPSDIKLNDSNYVVWAKMMEMFITRRGKSNHLTGTPSPPTETDPEERLYLFLAGVQSDLDPVRREILNGEPLPTLDNVYSRLRGEKLRHAIHLPLPSPATAGSDLVGAGLLAKNRSDIDKSSLRDDKSSLKCTHCGGSRHTRDGCFKIIGYPEWWEENNIRKKKGKGQGAGNTATVTTSGTQKAACGSNLIGQTEENSGNGQGSGVAAALQGAKKRGGTGVPYDREGDKSESLALNSIGHAHKVQNASGWIFDSGATDTMTNDSSYFVVSAPPSKSNILNATSGSFPVIGGGTVSINPTLNVSNSLYDIHTGTVLGRGTEKDGLYYVEEVSSTRSAHLAQGSSTRQLWLWHRRYGHPSSDYLRTLFPEFKSIDIPVCTSCVLAKSHKSTYHISTNKSDTPFSIIHSDVWGPAPESVSPDYRYFVTFIDDCTRVTWVYLLKQKSEVAEKFCDFFRMIKTQFHRTIQVLRSDNGGEFVNNHLQTFFRDNGILHQTTCPYTPQQNGVAERKNRHILETARALLFEAQVPPKFWAIGVLTQSLNGSSLLWTALFWKRNIFFPSPTSSEGETTAQSPPLPNWLSQGGPELDHSSLPESTPELGDTDHLVQSSVSTSQPEPDTVEYPEEHTTEVCESELSPNSNNLTTEPISFEVPETGQYVLPPRNNRGIPPRRYDPEFEAARSRYPMANVTRGERLSPQLVNLQKNICLEWIQKDAAELRCDNKAAISISENPVQHDRTKHVEIDQHFIKEKLDSGLISLPFVRSNDQWADILTKAVAGRIFHEDLGKLGMLDPHEPT